MTLSARNFPIVTYKDDEAHNRSSYRLKLLLFALLPYACVFAILAPIVTLFVLLLWTIISGDGRDSASFRIQLALAVVAALFLRSIWTRVPPPRGLTLPGSEPSTRILQLAREIARAIRGPRVHAILWDDEFDLSIVAVPRGSLPGLPLRYYLKIGLPLLHALSPEQFRARLAQELGLFAGAHGRFRSWLYANRFIWPAVYSALANRGRWGSWLFSRFFYWYVRSFIDYANDAFRYHEYEADRCAADATSAEIAAEALLRIECGSYLQGQFWDKDYDEASEAEGDYAHIAMLLERVSSGDHWAEEKAREWMECELTNHKEISAAYLVRKEVNYRPEKPLHTLGVVVARSWFRKTPDLAFAKRFPPARPNPPELFTFVLDYKNRRLGNIIRNIPNSLIYKKSNEQRNKVVVREV